MMIDNAKRRERIKADPDKRLLTMLKSENQMEFRMAFKEALILRTPEALAALEETIALYSGNPDITFYRLGGQRVYTQDTVQSAKEQIMDMALNDTLLEDPAHTQSLIASLGSTSGVNELIMSQLAVRPQVLYHYQLLGVQMQLAHLVEKNSSTGLTQDIERISKPKADFQGINLSVADIEEMHREKLKKERELKELNRTKLEKEKEKKRVEDVNKRINEMKMQMMNMPISDIDNTHKIDKQFKKRNTSKQVMLMNKLLSPDVNDIKKAVKSLSGFAFKKKKWALNTINQTIIMLEYIAKQLYSSQVIENKETNNFIVQKLGVFEIGKIDEYMFNNKSFYKNLWIENLKKIAEYPLVMLADFAVTQEIIYAVSATEGDINGILGGNNLARRLYELLRGQMKVQALYYDELYDMRVKYHICKRCGGCKFNHKKFSYICVECGKQIIIDRESFTMRSIFGIACIIGGIVGLSYVDEEIRVWSLIIAEIAGLILIRPILSVLINQIKEKDKELKYKKYNKEFCLSKEQLFERERIRISKLRAESE